MTGRGTTVRSRRRILAAACATALLAGGCGGGAEEPTPLSGADPTTESPDESPVDSAGDTPASAPGNASDETLPDEAGPAGPAAGDADDADDTGEAGLLVVDAEPASSVPEPVALSDTQATEVAANGPPDRFVIEFLTLPLADGTVVEVRHEVWSYDGGERLVFRNGELFGVDRDREPVESDALGSTPYRPETFVSGMTVAELLAVTGEVGYYTVPTGDAIPGGAMIVVRGLMAGFVDDGLVHVEALPVERP